MRQMQQRDLLVQYLRQHVDANILLPRLAELDVLLAKGFVLGLVEQDLREHLVGEGARHDEGRVARCAAEVHQASLGEEDDVHARGERVAVHLGFDIGDFLGRLFEPGDVDFDVEVADV